MKTNLFKIQIAIKVPEDWDSKKCNKEFHDKIHDVLEDHNQSLETVLKAIDPDIEIDYHTSPEREVEEVKE